MAPSATSLSSPSTGSGRPADMSQFSRTSSTAPVEWSSRPSLCPSNANDSFESPFTTPSSHGNMPSTISMQSTLSPAEAADRDQIRRLHTMAELDHIAKPSPLRNHLLSTISIQRTLTPDEAIDRDQIRRLQTWGELNRIVKPSPLQKPLDYKLQARNEVSVLPRPRSKESCMDEISPITVARRRAEASRKLEGLDLDETDLEVTVNEGVEPGDNFFRLLASSFDRRPMSKLGLYTDYALRLASGESVDAWVLYLQNYSKGKMNYNDPISSPPFGTTRSLKYLPAIFPANENTRRDLTSLYAIEWGKFSKRVVTRLLRKAEYDFGVTLASFSVFEDDYEIIQGERKGGFGKMLVPRELSIAAHALYSTDVFVLLDATKDWRFRDNPLVTGAPSIRFFAAAPLLTHDDVILGVFAVWSREPRKAFDFAKRQLLVKYSGTLMCDLTRQAVHLMGGIPSTGVQNRDSVADSDYQSDFSGMSLIDLDEELPGEFAKLATAALNSPKSMAALKDPISGSLSPESLESENSSTTARPAEDIQADRMYSNDDIGYENDGKYGFDFDDQHDEEYHRPFASRQRAPEWTSDYYSRPLSPRPFSTSDLTSHFDNPPNSREHSAVYSEDFDVRNRSDQFNLEDLDDLNDLDATLHQFPHVPDYPYFETPPDFSMCSDIPHSNQTEGHQQRHSEAFRYRTHTMARSQAERVVSVSSSSSSWEDVDSIDGSEQRYSRPVDEYEQAYASPVNDFRQRVTVSTNASKLMHSDSIDEYEQGYESSVDDPNERPVQRYVKGYDYKSYPVPSVVINEPHDYGVKPVPVQLDIISELDGQIHPAMHLVRMPITSSRPQHKISKQLPHSAGLSPDKCAYGSIGSTPRTSNDGSGYKLGEFLEESRVGPVLPRAVAGLYFGRINEVQVFEEAAQECQRSARILNYDSVYLVEIWPTSTMMMNGHLWNAKTLSCAIRTGYQLKSRLRLCPVSYLRIMREQEHFHWENTRNDRGPADEDYQYGAIQTIEVEPPVVEAQHRLQGTFLGVFRKKKEDGNSHDLGSEEEQIKLKEFGVRLAIILNQRFTDQERDMSFETLPQPKTRAQRFKEATREKTRKAGKSLKEFLIGD